MDNEALLHTIAITPDFDPTESFALRRISFFDHFLSIAEAKECRYIYYDLAVREDTLSEYLEAENCLLTLWCQLAIKGQVFELNDKPSPIVSLNDVLSQGTKVVRERGSNPVFFGSLQLIWEPSYDLTHLLWLPKTEKWTKIERLVRMAKLNFLD